MAIDSTNLPGASLLKVRHPADLIPHDFDFGDIIFKALQDKPSKDAGNFLRYYDEAVEGWLRGFSVIGGKSPPIIMAGAKTAFAEYSRLLVKCNVWQSDSAPKNNELALFPLPFISFSRGSPEPRDWGYNPYPIRNIGFVDGKHDLTGQKLRGTAYTRYPDPITIPYQIDIWTKYNAEHVWLYQRLQSSFWKKIAYWRTNSPFLDDKSFVVPIHQKSFEDTTDLVPTEQDVIHRWTLTVNVEAWMFHDLQFAHTAMTETKQIEIPGDGVVAERSNKLTTLAPTPLNEMEYRNDPPIEYHE